MSEKTKRKISNALKGKIPKNIGLIAGWNKGTKGICKPNSGSFKKGEHRSLITEFKKNISTWNKGLKGYLAKETNPNWKGGKPKCLDCNKILASYLAKRCKICRNKQYSGSNSHYWKGGITPINKMIRTSLEYKLWRKTVFERDDYRCFDCGVKNGEDGVKNLILNADHIDPFAYFPRLQFDINNGRTLCQECHRKTPTFAQRAKNYSY